MTVNMSTTCCREMVEWTAWSLCRKEVVCNVWGGFSNSEQDAENCKQVCGVELTTW